MITRRQWLRLLAAAAARGAVAGAAGCATEDEPALVAATFEVGPRRAVIAAWSSRVGSAELELVPASGEPVARRAVQLDAARGGTGAVMLDDLQPDTGYAYRLWQGSAASPLYRFRTAPPDDARAPLRFAFSADLDTDPEFASPILSSMLAREPAFYVSLGDWPYADNAPAAVTLAEFRARHRDARLDAAVQPLLESLPIYAIWDDHEVRNDWDGRFRVEEADRIAAGMRAWDEWFPTPDRPDPDARYRSWRWGALAELFVLDVRSQRSANAAPDGADKTMLGDRQRAWLEQGLRDSTAAFKLVMTPVPLDFGWGGDCWSAFRRERDAILGAIVGGDGVGGVGGVVVLSADQHWFAAHHHAVGIKEFQAGPLARGVRQPRGDAPEIVHRALTFNFGEVEILPDPVRLVVRAFDADGEQLYEETVAPGRGVLRVDAPEGPRGFRTEGAHRFSGVAPAEFPYAVPGPYRVIWDDGSEGPEGELADGGVLAL